MPEPAPVTSATLPASLPAKARSSVTPVAASTAGIVPWQKKITSDSRSPKNRFSLKKSRVSAGRSELMLGTALLIVTVRL